MTDIMEIIPTRAGRFLRLLENIHRPENASTRASALVAVRHVLALALGEKVPPITYPIPAEDMPPGSQKSEESTPIEPQSDEKGTAPTLRQDIDTVAKNDAIRRILRGVGEGTHFTLWHSSKNARTCVVTGTGEVAVRHQERGEQPFARWTPCGNEVFSMDSSRPYQNPEWLLLIDRIVSDYVRARDGETVELLRERLQAAACARPWVRLDQLHDCRIVDGSQWLYCYVTTDGAAKYRHVCAVELRALCRRDDADHRFAAELHRRGPVGLLPTPTKEADPPG